MRVLAALATIILAVSVSEALACSCAYAPPKTLEQIKAEKLKVLLGSVLSRTKTGGADINAGMLIYEIEIEQSINLPTSGTIAVSTPPNSALCGVDLAADRRHVLFINGEAPDYKIFLCSNIGQSGPNEDARQAWKRIMSSGATKE